jgi:biofilm PGA synthesis N-glycosyltransferase PgaC
MTKSNCSSPENAIRCSLAITAYNEAANIGRLLESLKSQRLSAVSLEEIFVIITGCTDGTEAVVRHFAAQPERVRVLMQTKREGNAAAVNSFLAEARERILVLCSADLMLRENTIDS